MNDWDEELAHLLEGQLDQPKKQRCIVVVLTPVHDAVDLKAMMVLHHIEATAIDTDSGAVIYTECEVDSLNQFEELLGEQRPVPVAAEQIATNMSLLMSHYGVVLCVSWLSDNVDETSQLCGHVIAKRYVNGTFDTDLPAGQLISTLSSSVENLLLGLSSPEEFDEAHIAPSVTKLQAFHHLRRRARYTGSDDSLTDEDSADDLPHPGIDNEGEQ